MYSLIGIYGPLKEELLRDCLVVGIRDAALSQKLQVMFKKQLSPTRKPKQSSKQSFFRKTARRVPFWWKRSIADHKHSQHILQYYNAEVRHYSSSYHPQRVQRGGAHGSGHA